MFIISRLGSYLGSKMSAVNNNQRSVTLTCIVLFPAGEITVPVSNKIEGILNKHWHTFVSMARFSDSSFFELNYTKISEVYFSLS